MPKQPTATGEAVTRAAADLMAARGYHGTSMRDVAKAVDMQMASVYYYHSSKQDLLVHLMRTTLEDLIAAIEQAMDRAGQDPVEQLQAGLKAHIVFHIERRSDVIVADSELRSLEPDRLPEIIQLRRRHRALLQRPIQRGADSGVFEIGRIGIVTTGITTLSNDVALWFDDAGELSVEGVADEIIRFVLRGLKAA